MSPSRTLGLLGWVVLLGLGAGLAACGSETDEGAGLGAPCGPNVCAETQYCCYPECGLCADQLVSCPQDGCP